MSRSPTSKALALGLIALFQVAVFSDVAMLLCAPQSGTHAVAPAPGASEHASLSDASHAGMAHHGMASEPASDEQGDSDQSPQHDHDYCDYCCAHGRHDFASFPALAFSREAPARGFASVAFVGLYLSTTPTLHTLPNPPPVA